MEPISFSTLALAPEILQNLESLGYKEMTPIQAKSLPLILKNHDILAKAKTGSGKTAAFGLGVLAKLDVARVEPQAMIICPTRELADQVAKEMRRLARFTPNIRVLLLCGGKPFRVQAEALWHGVHIVVGTPGRIKDHIEKQSLILKNIQTLVLDEADRMLDMGFYDSILDIINFLPITKQTLLFSATYPRSISQISQLIQKNPIEITVDIKDDTPNINQMACQVREFEKTEALISLLGHYSLQSTIVFCKTKIQCDEIAKKLHHKGFHVLAIHGDLEQREREEVLLQFSNQSCTILVATDVAARGLDIKDLPLVINYDMPSSPEIYIHRIGRTGRNGQSGLAISIFLVSEIYKIEEIEKHSQITINRINLKLLNNFNKPINKPTMRTLCISGGKKNKIRPGDILGALTGDMGLIAEQVGKIDIFDFHTYVAISRKISTQIFSKLENSKIKGRVFRIRYLDSN